MISQGYYLLIKRLVTSSRNRLQGQAHIKLWGVSGGILNSVVSIGLRYNFCNTIY